MNGMLQVQNQSNICISLIDQLYGKDRPLRLRVLLDQRQRGGNVCIGQCETTLRMILNTQRSDSSINGFSIFKSIDSQVPVGRLDVPLAQVIDLKLEQEVVIDTFQMNCVEDCHSGLPRSSITESSFSAYIDNGWLLDFLIAIDFTSSNGKCLASFAWVIQMSQFTNVAMMGVGDPRIPGTLHDQATESLNDYEECIEGIGGALEQYAEACTVWGFGAKFEGVTRHLFQLGSMPTGTVDSILQAYRSIFQSDLIMSGPTLFDQVRMYSTFPVC